MIPLSAILLSGAAFALSAWLTWRFTRPGSFFHVLDHPNERSLHSNPVPRTGGVAIIAAWLAGTALVTDGTGPLPLIAVTALALALVSFAEDRYGVPRRYRLLAHLGAAAALPAGGLQVEFLQLGVWTLQAGALVAVGLTLFFIVWMVNLYNFMDGMDGFAGGMGAIGFAALAYSGWLADAQQFALANALLAAACGGFLLWNFPGARIFMGDAGSTTLGFLASAMALWAARDGILPLWASLLIFSPFIVDASVTLLRRLWRGERVWQAHRSHYYQRLVNLGWSHRKTVLRAYLLMAACAATALSSRGDSADQVLWLLGMWAVVYGVIAYKVRLMERRVEGLPT
jgi:UDP-N-acetylmuramyl pentapeptide phosphotransferase/UDP-N-acetylglucosamine-1-phosphate transferase